MKIKVLWSTNKSFPRVYFSAEHVWYIDRRPLYSIYFIQQCTHFNTVHAVAALMPCLGQDYLGQCDSNGGTSAWTNPMACLTANVFPHVAFPVQHIIAAV